MSQRDETGGAWRARGLLFENCSCQTVCPGHVRFQQLCTHERCVGYWAIRIDEGRFGEVGLGGLCALVSYDAPQHMIDGDWTQLVVIDERASAEQRQALETILFGRAGGPWTVLGRFVGTRLDTRFLPVRIDDDGKRKCVVVEGLVDSTIEAIRGRDRAKTVNFENMFNQIHAPSQVIATGSSSYDDGTIVFDTEQTHALYSSFDWTGP